MTDNSVRRMTALGGAAIAGQLLFVGGWLVVGMVEGDGYSAGRHDVSDLGALTAHHATASRLTEGIGGALTIAFAVLVLRPCLRSAGRSGVVGAWLVAASLPAFDTMSDAFFRLDCRAADAGCTAAQATASWHAKAHLLCFGAAALATVVAPFVLSRAMRRVDGWQDLAGPARTFGIVVIAALAVTGLSTGTALQGWTQRGAILLVACGISSLAWRVLRLESRPLRAARLVAGR
ncbi:DUF998 domain-containing protein [Kribbella sp. NPDC051620]|uniref:DUF998 domain-containing protein n=1 Tax=Kribbella sp. NPDC051620 TaxID=3364120 RepID=UPI0037AA82A3